MGSRILIVANGDAAVGTLVEHLEGAGYDVCGFASSADEAVFQAGKNRPDVVLVGLEPRGIETAQQLHRHFALPVVYLVGEDAGDAMFERARAARPGGFVFDASRRDELKAAIDQARSVGSDADERPCTHNASLASAILDTAGSLIVVLDRQGRIVCFNRTCEQVTGYSFAEVRGRPLWDLLLPSTAVDEVREVFQELLAGSFPNHHENVWLTRDGRRRLIAWSNTAITDDEGQVQLVVGTGIDVTEQRQADQERERHVQRVETLLQVSQEMTAETGVDGLLRRTVEAACVMTGARLGLAGRNYQAGRFLQSATFRAPGPVPSPPTELLIEQAAADLDLIYETGHVRLAGAERGKQGGRELAGGDVPLRGLLAVSLVGRDGKASGLILVSNRIEGDFSAEDEASLRQLAALASVSLQHLDARLETEARTEELLRANRHLREAEEELQQHNEELQVAEEELRVQNSELLLTKTELESQRLLYQDLFELAPDGYLVTDRQGMILEANQAASALLSVDQHRLVGKPLAVFVSSSDLPSFYQQIECSEDGPEPCRCEMQLQPRDRPAFHAALTVAASRSHEIREGRGILRWLIRDIAERKLAEAEREQLLSRVDLERRVAQELSGHLVREREVLNTIMENTRTLLAYLDPQFNFVAVNSAYARGSGHEREELVGSNHFALFSSEENEAIFRQVRDSGQQVEFVARPFEYGGQPERGITYWDWTLIPVKDAAGEVQGLVLSLADVTERILAGQERERLLEENRAQREFLELLVESASVGIAVLRGPDHRFELVNPMFRTFPGVAGVSVLGVPVGEVLTEPAIRDLLDQVYRTGSVVSKRDLAVGLDPGGDRTFWNVDLVPLPGARGAVERLLVLARQVTDQVLSRQRIEELAARDRERAEELSAVFAAMADAVVVYDAQNRAVRANPTAIALYGMDPVGASHRSLSERLSIRPAEEAEVMALPASRAQHGETVRGQRLFFTAPTGEEHTIVASAAPVRVEGHLLGVVTAWHDVTAEERVQQARDRLAAILEATPDMVSMAYPDGRVFYYNGAARRALGIPEQADLDGATITRSQPAWASELVAEQGMPTATRHGIWQGRSAVLDAEGQEIPVSLVILAHKGPGGEVQYFSTIARDITERERILGELAEERARLRAVIDSAPDGIVVADAQARVLLANPAAERLYARPVPYGQDYQSQEQLQLSHADGTRYDPRDLPLTRSALDGETRSNAALRITWPDGQQRNLLANSTPIRNADGLVTGAVAIFRDVTEQVQAEEDLRRFSGRLQILYDIDQAILAIQSPAEVMPSVLERLVQLVPCSAAGVLTYDRESDQARASFFESEGGHVDEQVLPLADLPGEAEHRQGKVYQVKNLVASTQRGPLEAMLLDRSLRSYVSVPLLAGDGSLGALIVGSSDPGSMAADDVEIVREVARSLALAIQHDRLREQLVRHADQLAASLRDKEIMLQEIHHRVKNNLQIISSLLDMQATAIQDPPVVQALQDSRNRVKAMALIHEKLYQSPDLGSIRARSYVRSITAYLFGVHTNQAAAIRLEVDVDDVFLDLNTAIPCGLILNELISNSLKHAFPTGREEAAHLRIRLDKRNGEFVLEVSDNGVGIPASLNWHNAETLGLRLVNVLTQQLRGKLELDRSAGTTFRVTFSGRGKQTLRR